MSTVIKKLNNYLTNFRSYSKTDKPIQLSFTEVKQIIKTLESCKNN